MLMDKIFMLYEDLKIAGSSKVLPTQDQNVKNQEFATCKAAYTAVLVVGCCIGYTPLPFSDIN